MVACDVAGKRRAASIFVFELDFVFEPSEKLPSPAGSEVSHRDLVPRADSVFKYCPSCLTAFQSNKLKKRETFCDFSISTNCLDTFPSSVL